MFRRFAITCLLVSLSACSSFEFPGVYKLAIDQGNIITGDMVAQLEVGMSRSQVEFILGSPLIRDSFSPNRWDYLYTLNDRDGETERNQLSVFFEENRVSRYETDVAPTEEEDISTATDTLVENAEEAAKDAEKQAGDK